MRLAVLGLDAPRQIRDGHVHPARQQVEQLSDGPRSAAPRPFVHRGRRHRRPTRRSPAAIRRTTPPTPPRATTPVSSARHGARTRRRPRASKATLRRASGPRISARTRAGSSPISTERAPPAIVSFPRKTSTARCRRAARADPHRQTEVRATRRFSSFEWLPAAEAGASCRPRQARTRRLPSATTTQASTPPFAPRPLRCAPTTRVRTGSSTTTTASAWQGSAPGRRFANTAAMAAGMARAQAAPRRQL